MVRVWSNLPYATPSRCILDVYKCPRQRKGPTIVCTHGGSWMLSDKSSIAALATLLAQEGFCVIAPSYRLSVFDDMDVRHMLALELVVLLTIATCLPRGNMIVLYIFVVFFCVLLAVYLTTAPKRTVSRHPDHAEDLAAVIKWAHLHAEKYGGDNDRLLLLGYSAGGHLTALVANNRAFTRRLNLPDHIVRGVVVLSGVFSDKRMRASVIGRKILDVVFGRRAEHHDAFPIYHCHATSPPHLLVNAECDFSLRRHTFDFFFALREQGVYVRSLLIPSTSHFDIYTGWTRNSAAFQTIVSFLFECVGERECVQLCISNNQRNHNQQKEKQPHPPNVHHP